MIFEKIRERLQDALSNVNVNRITDNIIKDKPKELGQIMAYNRALDIINQVEAEYNNGWIRCEDKLPENLDSYLVVVKMKYEWETEWEYQTDVAYYTMEDGYIDGWNTFNDWNEGQECHIVYWQPLPQLPKGE